MSLYFKNPTLELKKLIDADLARNPHKRAKFNKMNEQIETTPEPYQLVIEINELPKILSNARGSWRVVHAQNIKWKSLVAFSVGYRKPARPLTKAKVTCTRFSSRAPDGDNIPGSFKHCIDGLVECGVLIDDNMAVIGMPEYKWEKVSSRQSKIRIEVREVL